MGDHVLQSAGYIFKTAEWISIKVVVGNSYWKLLGKFNFGSDYFKLLLYL
jgi:hypothetical protein